MTAHVERTSLFRLSGLPLFLGRATTLIAAGATCAAVDTWYAMDIGTMYECGSEGTADYVVPHPDFLATDIAGTDHKIEPNWPTGIYETLVYFHLYSAQLGTAHSAAENITLGLWDVSVAEPGVAGSRLLYSVDIDNVPVNDADTLTIDAVVPVRRTADLRLYGLNRSAAHNISWDPIRIGFKVCN